MGSVNAGKIGMPNRQTLYVQTSGQPGLVNRALADPDAYTSVAVNIRPLTPAARMIGSTIVVMLRMDSSCYEAQQAVSQVRCAGRV